MKEIEKKIRRKKSEKWERKSEEITEKERSNDKKKRWRIEKN